MTPKLIIADKLLVQGTNTVIYQGDTLYSAPSQMRPLPPQSEIKMKKTLSIALLGLSTILVAEQHSMPSMSQMFMRQFDADQDGKVTLAEFQTPSSMQFKQMDRDSNGHVSVDEIDAMAAEMQKRMQEMQQQSKPK